MNNPLQQLEQAILNAIRGMESEDFRRHPEGKWCAAEILEHLYRTHRRTVRGLERCLEGGKPPTTSSTGGNRVAKWIVVYGGYMPGGRKAPETVLPTGMPLEQLMAEFTPQITRMDDLIAQCEAKFGRGVKLMDHPFLGPLTGPQWRKFHWVHGQHHVKQIQALREKT